MVTFSTILLQRTYKFPFGDIALKDGCVALAED